ncbi:MAG: hypothetical protein J6U54_04605, partial [Clostridiales bacterium]|nr:hypothetical protein [Clostridiales bacterium]
TVSESDETVDGDWQIKAIFDNSEVWELSDTFQLGEASEKDTLQDCKYSVTDLDNDGCLEVIKYGSAGRDLNSYIRIFEVAEAGSIQEMDDSVLNGFDDGIPDFSLDEGPVGFYEDENGDRVYLVHDLISYGLEGQVNIYSFMTVRDNKVELNRVCRKELSRTESEETYTYQDGEGNEITEEEYEQIFAEFESCATDSFEFGWFTNITMDEIKASAEKVSKE